MPYFRLQIVALFLCTQFFGFSQSQQPASTVISLNNPSFNGITGPSKRFISGWVDCGRSRFPNESAPDLQPGSFMVALEPKEGQSYLGMVARDNETWESVTQLLRKPLEPAQCYTFSLYLASSEKYKSPARSNGIIIEEALSLGIPVDSIEHTTPIVLRIWGGRDQCELTELLGETTEIRNRPWKKFDFRFEPKTELNFIMLEAFYKTPSPFPQNGHILIDDLSDIVGIPCNLEPPVVHFVTPKKSTSTEKDTYAVKAKLKNVYNKDDIIFSLNDKMFTDFEFDLSTGELIAKVPLKKGLNKIRIKGANSEGENQAAISIKKNQDQAVVAVVAPDKDISQTTESPQTSEEAKSTLEGVKREDLKKDLKLEIKNISFKADSINIQYVYHKTLENIVSFLQANNDVVIEIGGHTNDRCADVICNKISEDRAKSVMDFLVTNGVNIEQLRSKGYGRVQPIASNNSAYGRKRNQRVEIKILDIGS